MHILTKKDLAAAKAQIEREDRALERLKKEAVVQEAKQFRQGADELGKAIDSYKTGKSQLSSNIDEAIAKLSEALELLDRIEAKLD